MMLSVSSRQTSAVFSKMLSHGLLTVNSLPLCNAKTLGNVHPVSTYVFFPITCKITCLPFSGPGSSSISESH